MAFPSRLMAILSTDEYSHIAGWLPHGKGFIIFQKKQFEAEVLPRYFKQSKFTSFTRKLNRWGFYRVSRGNEMGAYYHKLFTRDNPRLCFRMSCDKPPTTEEDMLAAIASATASSQQESSSTVVSPHPPTNFQAQGTAISDAVAARQIALRRQQILLRMEQERSLRMGLYLQLLKNKRAGCVSTPSMQQPPMSSLSTGLLLGDRQANNQRQSPNSLRRAEAA
mmetsp:Transcript_9618/g.10616  ORF Transcript_9618/g.10616 Transcript_9618/m.10616 type:complete len:222 (-) Transcript_9618:178-843(-)|eukprot:CAMPEP_0195248372 /NCGR_PEP_ID=MMETSP0706-20130129/1503_1 /TAXON_ID=33640 /ORGANISM="Asterionellopsis glacialis, Strain CCMP134" /LENGTH=221 /DNA_ID=CAMNT_0040300015 /DNA_START=83 /DNA_END=748 /DNA_ORIENTATION=+